MNHNLKIVALTICIALTTLAAQAQDKLYKKDGTEIDSKVKSVGNNTVIYKRFDNQDGPEYTILKIDIAKIVYQNGTTDVFEGFDKETGNKKEPGSRKDKHEKYSGKYGKDIFSIIPAAYTAAVDGNINDVGIGICYERLLDKRGRIGFTLPLLMSFSSTRDYANNSYNYNGTNVTYGNYTSIYFMPGIKFYPAPDRMKVRYAIGASFFCILGGEPAAVYYNSSSQGVYNPSTGTYTYPSETGTYHYAMYGLMFSNSVNITATRHLYMAIDLGAGIPFSDNRYANNGETLGVPAPFMQIGFKMGYRY